MLTTATTTAVTVTTTAGDLHSALRRVAYAASNEETRYYLSGVYMHPGDGGLKFVATDGRRLAQCRLDINTPVGLPGVILPLEFVKKLAAETKPLRRAKQLIEIVVRDDYVSINGNNDFPHLTCKPIDGTFPDYPRVIPAESKKFVHAPRDALLAAVRACTEFQLAMTAASRAIDKDESERPLIRLSWRGTPYLWVEAARPKSKEGAYATACVRVDLTSNPPAESGDIGFDGRFLVDAVERTLRPGTSARIDLDGGAGAPCRIREEADDTALAVVMPCRLPK